MPPSPVAIVFVAWKLNVPKSPNVPDCLFLNNPFKDEKESIDFVKKIINSNKLKKNILIILVNYNKRLIETLNNVNYVDSYYINEIKGYSILRLNG